MKKIIKLTESDLVKMVNEVILTFKQIEHHETPLEPFVYKVYSEEDIPSFEQTFKQKFRKDPYMHFPLVVIGFEARIPVLLHDTPDLNSRTYEIEEVRVYVPFMTYVSENMKEVRQAVWKTCNLPRVTKNNVPKEIVHNIITKMRDQYLLQFCDVLGDNPTRSELKAKMNSPRIIYDKISALLNPYMPKSFDDGDPDGDFEDVD